MGNSQFDAPEYGHRRVRTGPSSTDQTTMRSSRRPVPRYSGPSSPRMRTIHLTGYFLRPGDPNYAFAAKATGTKDNQDAYWFREAGGDMMGDELEGPVPYSFESEDLPDLAFDSYAQLSQRMARRALKQELKVATKKDAVVDISSEAVVDKKGKGPSTGEKEIRAEQFSKTGVGSRKVTEASPHKLQDNKVDDISVAMPQEAQELTRALKLLEGTASRSET